MMYQRFSDKMAYIKGKFVDLPNRSRFISLRYSLMELQDNLKILSRKLSLKATKAFLVILGNPINNFCVEYQMDGEGVYHCSFSLKDFKRVRNFSRNKYFTVAVASVTVIALLFSFIFPGKPIGRAATNTWNQSDWSLGADIAALANHIANQTGWQKFYSKDANVIVGYGADGGTAGQVSLSATTSSITETTTADFAAGTQSNTNASNNSVVLLKPEGASCTADTECVYGLCASSTCSAFVTIGTQLWMKKNLNVGTRIAGSVSATNNGIVEKYCYSDTEANCTTDGGLYQWSEMMGYAATCNGTGASQPACTTPVKGICPSGTHIPSHYELTLLEKNVGSNPGAFPYDKTTNGWLGTNEGTNLKSSGSPYFYGVLAGYRHTDGTFNNRGTYALFWSSTESGANAWNRYLDWALAAVYRATDDKAYGFSVRCLKD